MQTSLPPGPSNVLLTTLHFAADPERRLLEWHARYGDPFTVRSVNGVVVFTADPAHIRRLFTAPPGTFGGFAMDAIEVIVGPGSVLTASEPAHMRDRKLLMPPLHGERMRAWVEGMADATRRHLSTAAGTVRMRALATQISLEVILRAVFGLEEQALVRAFTDAATELSRSLHPSFLFSEAFRKELFGLSPYARHRRAFTRLGALLQARIDEARRAKAPGEDVLSLLLAARYDDDEPMRDVEVLAQLRALLFAGHETTAVSLAWAVYELEQNPGVKQRLLDELEGLDDDAPAEALLRLPFLEAVAKETLRRHPVFSDVYRVVRAPYALGAHTLPEGTAIAASAVLAHLNPDVYEEPRRFSPERFLGKTYGPDVYLPFGGGSNRCIGAAFAHTEMRVVLGTLFRSADIRLVDPRPVRGERRHIALEPKGGVEIAVSPRQGSRRRAA